MLEIGVRILSPTAVLDQRVEKGYYAGIRYASLAERSFRTSFRKQPVSAKPSASFRAHRAKHVSETIRGIISEFKSSRDNRLKKPWLIWEIPKT